jgi:hypothetical protein
MSTITVENTNYEFQEIPGKGKCLVPVKKPKFNTTNVRVGSLLKWENYEYLVSKVEEKYYMIRTKSPYGNVGEVNTPSYTSLEGLIEEFNAADFELVRF